MCVMSRVNEHVYVCRLCNNYRVAPEHDSASDDTDHQVESHSYDCNVEHRELCFS